MSTLASDRRSAASDRARPGPRRAVLIVLFVASATIAGAWVFEYGLGLAPCPLCLMQRKPYYAAIALCIVALLAPAPERWLRAALYGLSAVFLLSAGLGLFHAGVEWTWWQGPSDCSGAGGPAPSDIGGFLDSLSKTRVPSCTDAAWRFLGLSLAGWNALISLALSAASAFWAVTSRGDRSPN